MVLVSFIRRSHLTYIQRSNRPLNTNIVDVVGTFQSSHGWRCLLHEIIPGTTGERLKGYSMRLRGVPMYIWQLSWPERQPFLCPSSTSSRTLRGSIRLKSKIGRWRCVPRWVFTPLINSLASGTSPPDKLPKLDSGRYVASLCFQCDHLLLRVHRIRFALPDGVVPHI